MRAVEISMHLDAVGDDQRIGFRHVAVEVQRPALLRRAEQLYFHCRA